MKWLLVVALVVGCSSKKESKDGPASGMPSSIQLAARYTRCLHAATVGAWDEYARCHVAKASIETAGISKRTIEEEVAGMRTARPQFQMIRREAELSLAGPKKLVAIEWLSATTAANKPIGIYIAHVVDFDDAGLITRDVSFYDGLTLRGQLGEAVKYTFAPPAGAFARHGIYERTGSATETANLDAYRQLVKYRNAHDERFESLLADNYAATDYVFGEFSKPALMMALRKNWKRDPNEGVVVEQVWAAGDYIAAIERYETSEGSAKHALRVLGVYELKDRKFSHAWFFFDRETYR